MTKDETADDILENALRQSALNRARVNIDVPCHRGHGEVVDEGEGEDEDGDEGDSDPYEGPLTPRGSDMPPPPPRSTDDMGNTERPSKRTRRHSDEMGNSQWSTLPSPADALLLMPHTRSAPPPVADAPRPAPGSSLGVERMLFDQNSPVPAMGTAPVRPGAVTCCPIFLEDTQGVQAATRKIMEGGYRGSMFREEAERYASALEGFRRGLQEAQRGLEAVVSAKFTQMYTATKAFMGSMVKLGGKERGWSDALSLFPEVKNEVAALTVRTLDMEVATAVERYFKEYLANPQDMGKVTYQHQITHDTASCKCGMDLDFLFWSTPGGGDPVSRCFHCGLGDSGTSLHTPLPREYLEGIFSEARRLTTVSFFVTPCPGILCNIRGGHPMPGLPMHMAHLPTLLDRFRDEIEEAAKTARSDTVSSYDIDLSHHGLSLASELERLLIGSASCDLAAALGAAPMGDRATGIVTVRGPSLSARKMHADPVGAVNIAIAADVHNDVLATWYFVSPTLPPPELAAAKDFFDNCRDPEEYATHAAAGQAWAKSVRSIDQRDGDLVVVHAGWPHVVWNVRANKKIAFDTVFRGTVDACAHNWRTNFHAVNKGEGPAYFKCMGTLLRLAISTLYKTRSM